MSNLETVTTPSENAEAAPTMSNLAAAVIIGLVVIFGLVLLVLFGVSAYLFIITPFIWAVQGANWVGWITVGVWYVVMAVIFFIFWADEHHL